MLRGEWSPSVPCTACVAGPTEEGGTVIKTAGPELEAAKLLGELSSEEERRTCGAGPGIEDEAIVGADVVPCRAVLG